MTDDPKLHRSVLIGAYRYINPDDVAAERNHAINAGMKWLYDRGCRRMRTLRAPRRGDYDHYVVFGW